MNPLANTIGQLASALERAGIPYVIGGSVASSVRGIVRATFDVDVVARIGVAQTDGLAAHLGPDWYADADQMRDSIAARRASMSFTFRSPRRSMFSPLPRNSTVPSW